MATVTRQTTGETTTDAAAVAELVAAHGLVYERWEISKLAHHPRQDGETAEAHILRVFADEIEALKVSRGYATQDVIALSPAHPQLHELLAKFDKEHIHTEDEVRFTVSGRGIFTIRGLDDELYDIEVHPGDLLAVPEGTKHYFTLCEDRQIQCIRLFTDATGWVAHYVENGAFAGQQLA